MPEVEATLAAIELRGRRLRRSVVVFSDGEPPGELVRLDAEPMRLEEAGALVLDLLDGVHG
jgi:hypothetical protein